MKVLIIINDAPYGSEKAYNALRLAIQMHKDYEDTDLTVFLMADAVGCAIPNKNTHNEYSKIARSNIFFFLMQHHCHHRQVGRQDPK